MSPTSYLFKLLHNIYFSSRALEYFVSDSDQLQNLPPSRLQMVRSTIIVRASDALPLAASVDDEQVLP